MTALQPDSARLQATLDRFSSAEVGGTEAGGVSRPAASDFDKLARDGFRESAENLGLAVRVDDIGNMYARRSGTDDDALPVVIGSHLDTVVPGGRFDGILGVSVALETIGLFNDSKLTTRRPIEVVNWTGEEGARFAPAMIGSGVVTGVYDIRFALALTDSDGLTLGSELERIGYAGASTHRLKEFFAALELHVEQGTVLEQADLELGIVSVIEPVRWCTIAVSGPGGHAGGPGPACRQDAMIAAARMMVEARDLSLDAGTFKTTIGKIAAQPGSNNVIPHVVTFNLDVRSGDDAQLDDYVAALEKLFARIAGDEGVTVDFDAYWSMRSAPFDPRIRSLIAAAADRRGVGWTELRGKIGHDSLHLAQRGPTAMIFTPTRLGRSHCEDEFSPWGAVIAAAGIYADVAYSLANAASLED